MRNLPPATVVKVVTASAGVLLLAVGIALVSIPAALIVTGSLILASAVLPGTGRRERT